jgi:threonine/homoserine/homoserine lactone efflux protein
MDWPVDPARYGAFLVIMAVMAITPGPANLFSVANGASRGRSAVLPAFLGMTLASSVWFAGAALGLGALMKAFPQVFRLIIWGGGLYVVWLGLKTLWSALRDKGDVHAISTSLTKAGSSAFWDGFMVQIANPKALLFFAAVLPPFLDTQRAVLPQMLLFAAATLSMDAVSMLYGFGGVALAQRLDEPRFRKVFNLVIGLLLIVVASLILMRS